MEQKSPEEQLQIERSKLKAILSETSDGVIIVDLEKKVKFFNKGIQIITGHSNSEAEGTSIGELIKLFSEKGEIQMDEFCPTGEFDSGDIVFEKKHLKMVGKSNNEVVVDVVSKKILGGSAVDTGCILIIRDSTREQNLEQMKLDFVSLAAHELRTPLTTIRGFLEILVSENTLQKLDQTEKTAINTAKQTTEKLVALIENILIISQIEKGELSINPVETKIEIVVSQVVEHLRPMAKEKGLQILFTPPLQKIPKVYADVTKIKDVLNHLIINAIDYTDEGFISINVEEHISITSRDDYVLVSVKDTGKGISQNLQPHVFSKFFRAKEKSLVMEKMGKGLGLFISKNIIESHKGEISLESRVGEGTTVFFTLPVKR